MVHSPISLGALTTLALTSTFISAASAQNCQNGAVDDGGNWYCSAVKQITYTGWSGAGSYNKITNMDPSTGACASSQQAYSGSMAPMDEDVSFHFRGPLQLKQFAFYSPSSSTLSKPKQKAKRHSHGHAHFHDKKHAHPEHVHMQEQPKVEPRAVGDWVTAVIDGVTVSWINEYSGLAATSAAAAVATTLATTTAAAAAAQTTSAAAAVAKVAAAQTSTTSALAALSLSTSLPVAGSWTQEAYYNAATGYSSGLTFLNHFGGVAGSGTWDINFGNSLSYASPDGTTGAASPQVLQDTQLPSSAELVIMSDKPCTGSSCGYSRPGNVAYHGFDGAQKLFLMEFSMPDDGSSGYNLNMPAIWMLNAQIPRTLQYGSAECSCWSTGCGEFDLWEVLASGDKRAKSTLHSGLSGGDSDYFVRPTSGTIKVAVLMQNEQAVLKVLDDAVTFDSTLTSAIIQDVATSLKLVETTDSLGVSTFPL